MNLPNPDITNLARRSALPDGSLKVREDGVAPPPSSIPTVVAYFRLLPHACD
jgi:hypothetical protein